jgi:large subunit ribosomal protein L29
MTTIAELRELENDELLIRLAEAKQELFNLRFQLVTGQLDNYSRLGQVKRDIARAETLLREREISSADAEVATSAQAAAAPPPEIVNPDAHSHDHDHDHADHEAHIEEPSEETSDA